MKKYFLIFTVLMLVNCHASSEHHEHNDHHHDHKHEHKSTSLGAHVHGKVECSVAVDQDEIYLEVQSPAESLLGFEYQPKTEEEKKKWQKLSDSWNNNLMDSFKVVDLECQIHEPQMILNVDEKGSHAQIHAQAHLKCPEKLNQKKFKINLHHKFEAIKEINIEVLPSAGAPYKKDIKRNQNTVELKL